MIPFKYPSAVPCGRISDRAGTGTPSRCRRGRPTSPAHPAHPGEPDEMGIRRCAYGPVTCPKVRRSAATVASMRVQP